MKKLALFSCVFFAMSFCLHAEIAQSRFKITENSKNFDINYIVTRDMQQIDSKENPDGTLREDSALFTNYDSFKFYDSKELYPANKINEQ